MDLIKTLSQMSNPYIALDEKLDKAGLSSFIAKIDTVDRKEKQALKKIATIYSRLLLVVPNIYKYLDTKTVNRRFKQPRQDYID